jgi:hypothetical protein
VLQMYETGTEHVGGQWVETPCSEIRYNAILTVSVLKVITYVNFSSCVESVVGSYAYCSNIFDPL